MRFVPFAVMLASLVLTPFSLRALNDWRHDSEENRSYLPSIENRRSRKSFRAQPIAELQYGNPEWVFIGDSMLGTRINAQLLGEISGTGHRNVQLLLQAASGPAYWYLAFKNYLIPSGAKPRVTFFFFRDTNMTDTMFRLRSQLGDALDEVAREREPQLNAIVAARTYGKASALRTTLNRLYEVDTASDWMHSAVRQWYALYRYPDPAARLHFENAIEENFNQNFRRDLPVDMAATEEVPDFYRDLPTSVLPLIIELSKKHDLPVCFVRVQRRPEGGAPPEQSPALVKYMQDFRDWAAANGAYLYDEHGDPELTLDLYEDGDHFNDRLTYTRIFRQRLDHLLR